MDIELEGEGSDFQMSSSSASSSTPVVKNMNKSEDVVGEKIPVIKGIDGAEIEVDMEGEEAPEPSLFLKQANGNPKMSLSFTASLTLNKFKGAVYAHITQNRHGIPTRVSLKQDELFVLLSHKEKICDEIAAVVNGPDTLEERKKEEAKRVAGMATNATGFPGAVRGGPPAAPQIPGYYIMYPHQQQAPQQMMFHPFYQQYHRPNSTFPQ